MESKIALRDSIIFAQELKDELDKRRKSLKAGNSKVYSVEESIQQARLRTK
jgi:hypothetical protein